MDHATIKKIGSKTKFQMEDPWVEKLAKSAMMDINYNIMIQYLETKAGISEIPNGSELKDMASYFRKLSVFTLKDGHSIILKDNNEILVPEKERQNMMGLAHAENHKGPQGMLDQLRGKVFWPYMNKQIYHMVSRCDPCQRLAKSHIQEEVEISHTPLFNTFPGHTIHVDYFEINNKDFIIMVDRLTGFVMCEKTQNKETEAAVLAIKIGGIGLGILIKL